MTGRRGVYERETGETRVGVEINIDGQGEFRSTTGLRMLDHLLEQLARHGRFGLTISAAGDLHVDQHHTVEDIAICLGRAFRQALGEKGGIARMGHALVPMDDALAMVAVDIGGRGYAVVEARFRRREIGDLESALVGHFLETFAGEARLNLHARLLEGNNDHHKAEALFKALAKALDMATQVDPRLGGKVPSTKEVID
ncbi:MAG TPA: imidazoleglycerol-phosphate dehydratase HisB [Dehalococcoidia bacterium]|nr:imidazoleglycerol-phosphate dehydratase HisB [Dehalococcoidia bacterium]